MPIEIPAAQPTICIRREAFERSQLSRQALDTRFTLTDDEFQVEGNLIVVGPLYGDAFASLMEALDAAGLAHFEDYFDLSGNWPEWLQLYAMRAR